MKYSFIYDPVALAEYKDAVAWYRERSETAALNFTTEVRYGINAICKDPLRYRNTHKNYRETSLKKYPYNIVYYLDEVENIIVIFSIFHYKRNPKKKYRDE